MSSVSITIRAPTLFPALQSHALILRCSAIQPFFPFEGIIHTTNNLPAEDRLLMASALKIAKHFPLGNKGLEKYGRKEDLPGEEAGSWWSTKRQGIVSAYLQSHAAAQY